MFHFFRKTITDFSFLRTDVHAHLLPGVDDGARDTADSLYLIQSLQELGFTSLTATPHVMAHTYPNTKTELEDAHRQLLLDMATAGISADLILSAEYMLDPGFEDWLQPNRLLSWGKQRYVLVEMSYIAPAAKLETYLFTLQMKHYQPILAHPERYLFYHNDFSKLEAIKKMGCHFQLNLLSLTGYYGPHVRRSAEKMLKKGMYEWAGTDTHNARQIEVLKSMTTRPQWMTKLLRYPFMNQNLYI